MTAHRLAAAANGQRTSLSSRTPGTTAAAMPPRAAFPLLRIVLGDSRLPSTSSEQPCPPLYPNSLGRPGETVFAGRVVLVVDDEPMILDILAEHCASLGMKVSEAGDGEGALRLVEAHPEIEVLITDVRMPGCDGPTLVERALALRPEIKVIFVTGYTTYRSSAWPILRKPFDLDELEAALRRALVQIGPASE